MSKGLLWPVTAARESRNMGGCEGSRCLQQEAVGFGPEQQAMIAGMAPQDALRAG